MVVAVDGADVGMDSNVVLVEGTVVNGVVLYLVAALLDVVVDGTRYFAKGYYRRIRMCHYFLLNTVRTLSTGRNGTEIIV